MMDPLDMDDSPDETLRLSGGHLELIKAAREQAAAACFSLVIYHRKGTTSEALLVGHPVIVGRAEPAQLVVADDSLSRVHAQFEVEAGQVWVEDLGSTNGTSVNGRRIAERVAVRPGDEIVMGAITAAVHGQMAASAEHGLLSHEHFLALLEFEVARARAFGRGLAVLMVSQKEDEALSRWAVRLSKALQPIDQAALYSPQVVEVLVPEATEELARQRAEALAASALRCGVAVFPVHAANAAELVQVSRDALQRSSRAKPVFVAPDLSQRATRCSQASAEAEPVVKSAAMREVYDLVDRVANSALPVLINGETGTGKELVATAIHCRSSRSGRTICCVNCGALPKQLIESALFGHERGAFTGADARKKGVFETAHQGTVFLDEIGELPPEAQVALLRVLETGKLTRVGGTKELAVDVRIVAATHRDLESMVQRGEFRQDLLYRLNTMTIRLPPLRERVDEIEALATRFFEQAVAANQRPLTGFDPEVLSALVRHKWPGNVRELRNVVERAVVITRGDAITIADLPETFRTLGAPAADLMPCDPDALVETEDDDEELDFWTRVRAYEAELIRTALAASGGNRTEAARALRIPMRTLTHKVRAYGL